jgi:hypothetical protein
MGCGAMSDARILVHALRDPASAATLDAAGWTALLAIARAEQLIATLAHRLEAVPKPAAAERVLADARASAEQGRSAALWEAEMARRALAPLGIPVILLKGTAYAAAGLAPAPGRTIGDLDILVPRPRLEEAEAALLAAGWEWVKPDPYDDAYYRRWMHELPPLIHRARDRMIDVHHTILPPTARITPDADALIAGSVPIGNGLAILAPADMICHAAAHLFADGDLAGGLRNLWDLHCLLEAFGTDGLRARAARHGLTTALSRAGRLAHDLYGTSLPGDWHGLRAGDRLYRRRLLARDGLGRPSRRTTRLAFYIRSHAIRMPPAMLARHLWIKWSKNDAR